MSLKDCPCRGCTERILLCHGRCERYQKWKMEPEVLRYGRMTWEEVFR